MSLIFVTSCAFCRHTFLPVEKPPCDPAMPEISKIKKDETEQLIALVRENVALYDQSSDDLQHLFFLNRRPAMVSNELVP